MCPILVTTILYYFFLFLFESLGVLSDAGHELPVFWPKIQNAFEKYPYKL